MFLSTDGTDEQGLQVSLWKLVFNRSECRKLEAGVSGVQVQPVHPGGHEDGL